ncbi:MAG: hypothetical protein OEM03_11530 [Chromatiales bacterium]|nr:hypothetical protein [Chromatiales bacterium]
MEREVLDRRAFGELRRLNTAFLALIHHCRGSAMASRLDCRSGFSEMIAGLDPEQAELLCTTRAALFSLKLDTRPAELMGVAEQASFSDDGADELMVREFGLVAASYAWHLSQTSPMAAALILGWSRERVLELGSLSLADVVRATLACKPAVTLRMWAHPRFWPDLLCSVRDPGDKGWEVARAWSAQFVSQRSGN